MTADSVYEPPGRLRRNQAAALVCAMAALAGCEPFKKSACYADPGPMMCTQAPQVAPPALPRVGPATLELSFPHPEEVEQELAEAKRRLELGEPSGVEVYLRQDGGAPMLLALAADATDGKQLLRVTISRLQMRDINNGKADLAISLGRRRTSASLSFYTHIRIEDSQKVEVPASTSQPQRPRLHSVHISNSTPRYLAITQCQELDQECAIKLYSYRSNSQQALSLRDELERKFTGIATTSIMSDVPILYRFEGRKPAPPSSLYTLYRYDGPAAAPTIAYQNEFKDGITTSDSSLVGTTAGDVIALATKISGSSSQQLVQIVSIKPQASQKVLAQRLESVRPELISLGLFDLRADNAAKAQPQVVMFDTLSRRLQIYGLATTSTGEVGIVSSAELTESANNALLKIEQNLDIDVIAIAIGDADGDRLADILILVNDKSTTGLQLYVLPFTDENRFDKAYAVPMPDSVRRQLPAAQSMMMSAADLDDDDHLEILLQWPASAPQDASESRSAHILKSKPEQ